MTGKGGVRFYEHLGAQVTRICNHEECRRARLAGTWDGKHGDERFEVRPWSVEDAPQAFVVDASALSDPLGPWTFSPGDVRRVSVESISISEILHRIPLASDLLDRHPVELG